MELKIVDTIKFLMLFNTKDIEFVKKIYKATAKYIEEKYNLNVEVKVYEAENNAKRIEFIVTARQSFSKIGEAVEFLVNYMEKKKEIEEDFSKLVSFYSQILKEVDNNAKKLV